MKMGRLLSLFAFTATLVLLLGLLPVGTGTSNSVLPRAYAADFGCGPKTLQGSYIYSAAGYLVSGGSNTPIAEAGVYSFDGAGGLSTTNTLSFGGAIIPRTGTGTYTVNSNCTGSAAVDGGVTFDFAVSRSNGEVRLVVSTPSFAVQGSMVRQ